MFYNTHLPVEKGGLRHHLQWHSRSAMERLTTYVWRGPRFAGRCARECRLSTQYRMHDAVCQVVDTCFYSGRQVRAAAEPEE